MKYFINIKHLKSKKSQSFSPIRLINSLIGLIIVLLINGCSYKNHEFYHATNQYDYSINSANKFDEVIAFFGNPGTGKSSLCNTILQENVFESGINLGEGMTKIKQEYIVGTTKYIDTPGLDDPLLREIAAREIEKALKENSNYKIVFVATLESGRIRATDLATINAVCEAIKTPFEYGLIFNKVSDTVLKLINKSSTGIVRCLEPLIKKPKTLKIISYDHNIADKQNIYFPTDSQSYKTLVDLIQKLQADNIKPANIEAIDVTDYKKKVEELEIKIAKITVEMKEEIANVAKEKDKIIADLQNSITTIEEDKKAEIAKIEEDKKAEIVKIEEGSKRKIFNLGTVAVTLGGIGVITLLNDQTRQVVVDVLRETRPMVVQTAVQMTQYLLNSSLDNMKNTGADKK